MKILAIGDIHAKFKQKQFLIKDMPSREEVDVVCLAGDMTNQGIRRCGEVEDCQEYLWELCGKYHKVLWIPGNHDIGVRESTFSGTNLDCIYHRKVAWQGYYNNQTYTTFQGVSCSPCYDGAVTVSRWDYMTDSWDKEVAAYGALDKCDVLVSHSPPYGVVDLAQGVNHIGSQKLTDYIYKFKPKIVICGHVHECSGEEASVDETRVVNVALTWKVLEI